MKLTQLPKSVIGWAMYDFANSAYATSVLSVIFNVYFASVLVPPEGVVLFGLTVPGESLWGYLISTVMLCVLILSPLLGSVADQKSWKKPFLMGFVIAGVISTLGMGAATPGRLWFAVACVFVGTLAYEMSLVFYNAFLKHVSTNDTAGRVSGLGFAFGYFGGGLCLLANLMLIRRPDLFGIDSSDKTLPIRIGMMLAGIWWLVFSWPLFTLVHETKKAPSNEPFSPLRRFEEVVRDVRGNKNLFRFLIAFLIYDDGIQTILLMASIFGAKALGMSAGELALCYLLIQFVAFFGAMICGRAADAWGHKRVVLVTLALYSGVVLYAVQIKTSAEFWALGVLVGLIMGGSQAASRSLYALMVPPEKSAELFSFYSIVGKAAAVVGPFLFGVVSQFYGLRMGVVSLLVFFVVGGALLLFVEDPKIAMESPTMN